MYIVYSIVQKIKINQRSRSNYKKMNDVQLKFMKWSIFFLLQSSSTNDWNGLLMTDSCQNHVFSRVVKIMIVLLLKSMLGLKVHSCTVRKKLLNRAAAMKLKRQSLKYENGF